MKVAIMQPYFFPYIGYFQLINSVDVFVIYDNIQYTKKGWINRNRILSNGSDEYVSLTLKKDSDYLDIVNRSLSDTWEQDRIKMLNKLKGAYIKSPQFKVIYPILEEIIMYGDKNLFAFIKNSLLKVCEHLNITTKFIDSSSIDADHSLKSEYRVMDICSKLNATQYINPIGGVELYNKEQFLQHQIQLNFLRSKPIVYPQFSNSFLPWLSIIDVLMFNEKDVVCNFLNEYTIE